MHVFDEDRISLSKALEVSLVNERQMREQLTVAQESGTMKHNAVVDLKNQIERAGRIAYDLKFHLDQTSAPTPYVIELLAHLLDELRLPKS